MKLSTLPIEILVKFDAVSEYLMEFHCVASNKKSLNLYIFKLHQVRNLSLFFSLNVCIYSKYVINKYILLDKTCLI